jgi:cell division transport system permease protein
MTVLRALRYFFEEALVSLWRSRLVTVVSVGTMAISLFVFGAFLIAASNLSSAVSEWSRKIQVTFYLQDGVQPHDRESLATRLQGDPAVASVEYVSREQAVERFKRLFQDLATLPEDLGESPFPAALEVTLSAGRDAPQDAQRIVAVYGNLPGVEEVQYDLLWVQRLFTAIRLTRWAGGLLGGILVLASVFTISNVVRLTAYSRQDEIDIMRLVGATQGYVKGPFIVEGMIQGGLGGLVAIGLLWIAFRTLVHDALAASDLLGRALVFLPPALCANIVLGGMIVGIVGGYLSLRRATL